METEPSKGSSSILFQKDLGSAAATSCHSMEANVIPPKVTNAHSGCDRVKGKRHWLGVDDRVIIISSDDESDSEKSAKVSSSKPSHQVGAIPRCSNNSKKQKSSSRWFPKEVCRPLIDEAPVFYPTAEEFGDTIGYIASIRQRAEPYGICRIVPPPSWKLPCPLKEKRICEFSKFTTILQDVDKLQNRESMRNTIASDINDGAGSDNDEKFGFQTGPDHTLNPLRNMPIISRGNILERIPQWRKLKVNTGG